MKGAVTMPRGGARRGAGRKAKDQPTEPLLTYSLTIRFTDVGVLNRLGQGNLSLGLRRLIDQHRAHASTTATAATRRAASEPPAASSPPAPTPASGDVQSIRGDEKGIPQYG
jgi:hypothetical protein